MKVIYIFIFNLLLINNCQYLVTKDQNETVTKESNSLESVKPKTETVVLNNVNFNKLSFDGVLKFNIEILSSIKDGIIIFNADNSVFGKIFHNNKEKTINFEGNDRFDVESYYPDYQILYILCNEKEKYYEVLINNEIKRINKYDNITIFENWDDHILNSYITTDLKNPVRLEPSLESHSLQLNYSQYHFIVTEIRNNWIRVKCNIDCEGCANEKIIEGWIMWKEGNNLKINLYYTC